MVLGVKRCMVERTISSDQSRVVVGGVPPTVRLSTLASPVAVLEMSRIVLVPAGNEADTVAKLQLVHAPVPGKLGVATRVPLTRTSPGRLVVVPFAKRMLRLVVCGAAELTVHSM